MKQLLCIVAIIFICAGCKKYQELKSSDDLNGKYFYSGQLLFANDLDSTGIAHPSPATHVQLFKNSEPVNYLFDSTTDNSGYFAFRNLKDGEYRIHINKVINNIIYDTNRIITVANTDYIDVPLTVKPSNLKQNGIVFTIGDGAGGVLNGTKVYMYSSLSLANADVNTDGTGSSIQLPVTNGYGKSAITNIPALPFYVIKMKTVTNLVKTVTLNSGISQYGIVRISENIP